MARLNGPGRMLWAPKYWPADQLQVQRLMFFPNEARRQLIYDWLYIRPSTRIVITLFDLKNSAGFTDIEFDPENSVNCQARSCAIFVAMMTKAYWVRAAFKSPGSFIEAVIPIHLPSLIPATVRKAKFF